MGLSLSLGFKVPLFSLSFVIVRERAPGRTQLGRIVTYVGGGHGAR